MICDVTGVQAVKNRKGQVAVEVLIMLGFFLAFSIPVILYMLLATTTKSDEVGLMQGRTAVDQLVDTANTVYMSGNGSRTSIQIFFPPRVKNFTIGESSGREIVMSVGSIYGDNDIVGVTVANVSTSTSSENWTGQGFRQVEIENNNGIIEIDMVNE